MSKDLKEKALEYHSMGKPGKIEKARQDRNRADQAA